MDTLQRITELIGKHYPSDASFEDALGVKRKTIDNWKRGRSSSYMKKLVEIAKLLQTTSAYLLCETDDLLVHKIKKEPIPEDEPAENIITLHRDGKKTTYRIPKEKLEAIQPLLEKLAEQEDPDL